MTLQHDYPMPAREFYPLMPKAVYEAIMRRSMRVAHQPGDVDLIIGFRVFMLRHTTRLLFKNPLRYRQREISNFGESRREVQRRFAAARNIKGEGGNG